jgi:hypothetical protein
MPKETASETIKAIHSLLPQSLAAQVNKGAGIDCKGYDEALVIIEAGATSGGGSHAFKVQECATDTDLSYADITDAAFTAITTANDNAVYVGRLNLRGKKRFIRVHNTGSTQALLASALVILMAARNLPVSQVNDVAFSV